MSVSLGDTMAANTHKMEIICSSFDSLTVVRCLDFSYF